ncbi:MAG: hypothetical protein K0S00_4827 [Xanthobacteraceae bacterium]|jgi:hypothetical protein|nr:hypothetical protein [Xanthobacteraceae bacterium]
MSANAAWWIGFLGTGALAGIGVLALRWYAMRCTKKPPGGG